MAVAVASEAVGVWLELVNATLTRNEAISGGALSLFSPRYTPPPPPTTPPCWPTFGPGATEPLHAPAHGVALVGVDMVSNVAHGGSGGAVVVSGTGCRLLAEGCSMRLHVVSGNGGGMLVQRGGAATFHDFVCSSNFANSGACFKAESGAWHGHAVHTWGMGCTRCMRCTHV